LDYLKVNLYSLVLKRRMYSLRHRFGDWLKH